MILGYNTNGFSHHPIDQAIGILAEMGYGAIGITLDHHVLNPFETDCEHQAAKVRRLLDRFGLRSVVETGARFLLDGRRKHQPTLISPTPDERARRIDFLQRSIDLAAALGSDAVSFWSGAPTDPAGGSVWWQRLEDGCRRVLDHAIHRNMRLAFEPEPGMLVDRLDRFERLIEKINHPQFGLTIDVGHLHCLGEGPIPERLLQWRDRLYNIHLEDMKSGVHDHLFFEEGQVDFPPIFAALRECGYEHGVYVELSRHSHDAVETARRAMEFLALLTA
jgi:L-ribulose-5-phosphate 3-epimerase